MLKQFKKTLAVILLIFFAVSMTSAAVGAKDNFMYGSRHVADHRDNHYYWDGKYMHWKDGNMDMRYDGYNWMDDKHNWRWSDGKWWDENNRWWSFKDHKWMK